MRWLLVSLTLVLALQGVTALMQRLQPAHYHVSATSTGSAIAAAGEADAVTSQRLPHFHGVSRAVRNETHAHASADRADAHPLDGHHDHRSRPAIDSRQNPTQAGAHHHPGVDRHAHARDDHSVVSVEEAVLQPALAGDGKPGFDGFVLALPPGWWLIDPRGRERWPAAIALAPASHHPGLPDRPPRQG